MNISNRILIYSGEYLLSRPNEVVFVGEQQLADIGLTSVFGICSDLAGNVYLSDPEQHVIVKITARGSLSIVAGQLGVAGNNGNTAADRSSSYLNAPKGLTSDKNGNIYIADSGNNQIRVINQNEKIHLLAGSPDGTPGYSGTYPILFNNPQDVAIDNSNYIYVADTGNNRIRRILSGTRTVVTVAGDGTAGDLAGYGILAKLSAPNSIAVNANGEVFIGDAGNYRVKRIARNGYVYNFSGSGVYGSATGSKDVCQFLDIYGIDTNRLNEVYVSDYSEGTGGRVLKLNSEGTSSRFNTNSLVPTKVFGLTYNDSRKIYAAETQYIDEFYSSSSSSSTSESSESSSWSSGSSYSSGFDDNSSSTSDSSNSSQSDVQSASSISSGSSSFSSDSSSYSSDSSLSSGSSFSSESSSYSSESSSYSSDSSSFSSGSSDSSQSGAPVGGIGVMIIGSTFVVV